MAGFCDLPNELLLNIACQAGEDGIPSIMRLNRHMKGLATRARWRHVPIARLGRVGDPSHLADLAVFVQCIDIGAVAMEPGIRRLLGCSFPQLRRLQVAAGDDDDDEARQFTFEFMRYICPQVRGLDLDGSLARSGYSIGRTLNGFTRLDVLSLTFRGGHEPDEDWFDCHGWPALRSVYIVSDGGQIPDDLWRALERSPQLRRASIETPDDLDLPHIASLGRRVSLRLRLRGPLGEADMRLVDGIPCLERPCFGIGGREAGAQSARIRDVQA